MAHHRNLNATLLPPNLPTHSQSVVEDAELDKPLGPHDINRSSIVHIRSYNNRTTFNTHLQSEHFVNHPSIAGIWVSSLCTTHAHLVFRLLRYSPRLLVCPFIGHGFQSLLHGSASIATTWGELFSVGGVRMVDVRGLPFFFFSRGVLGYSFFPASRRHS